MEDELLFRLLNGGLHHPIPIGRIDPKLARLIGANTNSVRLSPWSARKNRGKHSDLNLDHYRMMPAVLQFYTWAAQDKPRHLVLIYRDQIVFDANFKMVIKATRLGTEIFIESYHKLQRRRLNRFLRKHHDRIIRGPHAP